MAPQAQAELDVLRQRDGGIEPRVDDRLPAEELHLVAEADARERCAGTVREPDQAEGRATPPEDGSEVIAL